MLFLKKALDKLPSFQGNNVVSAKSHIKAFTHCINKWCGNTHEDVKMKLFVLSLEEDALDWFMELDDNKVKTIKELIDAFAERWGDRKENRHLLVALNSIKKNENETMEEFNKRFNELIIVFTKTSNLQMLLSSSTTLKLSVVKCAIN
jgi:hypothetical protein